MPEYFSTFEWIVLTAQGPDGVTPSDAIREEATLAARYAASVGWEDSILQVSTLRTGRQALSASEDGLLTLMLASGRDVTLTTGSVEETLDILVLHQILPFYWSSGSREIVADMAAAHERVAEHVLAQHATGGERVILARTWQAAADSARDYRLHQMRLLANDVLARPF